MIQLVKEVIATFISCWLNICCFLRMFCYLMFFIAQTKYTISTRLASPSCSGLQCWSTSVKIVRIWPLNWKSNIFPQLLLEIQIFIFITCLKVWEWEKYPQAKVDHFLNFYGFSCKYKVQLTPPHGNFINCITNPKIIFLEIFVLLNTNYNDSLICNNFQQSLGITVLIKNL